MKSEDSDIRFCLMIATPHTNTASIWEIVGVIIIIWGRRKSLPFSSVISSGNVTTKRGGSAEWSLPLPLISCAPLANMKVRGSSWHVKDHGQREMLSWKHTLWLAGRVGLVRGVRHLWKSQNTTCTVLCSYVTQVWSPARALAMLYVDSISYCCTHICTLANWIPSTLNSTHLMV